MAESDYDLEDYLRRHGPSLVLYARQWVDCHADAEDTFHDAFVQFWRRRGSVQDPVAYLYRCVRSAAMDWARNPRRRESSLVEGKDSLLAPRADASVVETEERQRLETALTSLPLEQREVLIMKHWGGLTFESIGEALGIPQRTAQSRYRYAIDRLRKELAADERIGE